MALNLTSRVQVTASRFWNKRNAAALSHHGVRLDYDPESRRTAALILGFTITLVAVGLMFLLSWFKPAGQVGQSKILADRDTGALYVVVDGRLHPALNLMSARLIAGENANPTFIKAVDIGTGSGAEESTPNARATDLLARSISERCPPHTT